MTGRSYYVIGKEKMNWSDARQTCVNIGGDLAACMFQTKNIVVVVVVVVVVDLFLFEIVFPILPSFRRNK